MRGRILPASLILLATVLLSGCTVTKSLSPEAQKKVQRVAIVSVIGHQILMKNSPFFRWDMEEYAHPIRDWGIDPLVKQEIAKQLGERYQIVPAEYNAADLQAVGSIGKAIKQHAKAPDADAYIAVLRAETGYGDTAVRVVGLGVIRGISGTSYHTHAVYGIAVIDAKTFEELAVAYAPDAVEGVLGMFHGRPNHEVTEAYWQEGEGAIPPERQALLKKEFESLIVQSLPETLQALNLIPKPAP